MTVNLTPWDNVSEFANPQTGALSIRGQVWLQTILEQINDNFGALQAAQDALAAAVAAQATADAATADAATAQATADAAAASAAESALATSGTLGCTLTAVDVGTTAAVSISTHTRVYADGTSVSVSFGSVPLLNFSTQYWIYYSDPTRAGGSVTYQATTSPATAVQTGNIHSVGYITTPADGAANTTGTSNPAPGNVS